MTWRSVVISRPARLNREHFSLVVTQEATVRVPFEDIAIIVLNHREIALTHPVLSACGEYGIGLFSIGDTHLPNGVFIPFLQHSRATRQMRLQMALTRPVVKQAWSSIVAQKISNQAVCLALSDRNGSDRLLSYARRVRSGDPENMEAQAAAFYFSQLFGNNFYRDQPSRTNACLNYGYAILRGAIARGLVAHGLFPAFGLFHDSEQNAFNLVDDIIEPFRPVVDLHVAKIISGAVSDEITSQDKINLISLLNVDMEMPQGSMSILSSIEYAIESLVRMYTQQDASLLQLPVLIGLNAHNQES